MGNATSSAAAMNPTQLERRSDREFVATRTFDAPARLVYEAWRNPDLFRKWWVPEGAGMTLESCEMDVRTGGRYRLVFRHPAFDEPMAFFGRYLDVELTGTTGATFTGAVVRERQALPLAGELPRESKGAAGVHARAEGMMQAPRR